MISVEVFTKKTVTPEMRTAIQLAVSTQLTNPAAALYIMPSEVDIDFEQASRRQKSDLRIILDSGNMGVIQELNAASYRDMIRALRTRLSRRPSVSLVIKRYKHLQR